MLARVRATRCVFSPLAGMVLALAEKRVAMAVLFFGSASHPGLDLLFRRVRDRGRQPAVFAIQERFPRDIALCLPLGIEEAGGFLALPGEEPLDFEQIRGVCMDGFFVDEGRFQDLDPSDLEYAQTESWAALIALFATLSRTSVVANHLARLTLVSFRLAELSWLAGQGFAVPRALATSSPKDAREFIEALDGRVVFKGVSGGAVFRPMQEDDFARLDALRHAPAHFEEAPDGETRRCVVIGERVFVLPGHDAPPEELQERCKAACRAQDIWMGEVVLRQSPRGWLASGLRTFPGADCFVDDEMGDAAAALLEGA